nr:prepilin-type N-terminal cleavage/methylation domain-containing protein [Acinetobacter wuhouensis]
MSDMVKRANTMFCTDTNKMGKSKGFTLIELMIVVVIIAILAAIAIPSYREYVRRATASQAMQEVQKLAEQLERHKARNFSYLGFNGAYLYKNNLGSISSSYDGTKAELTLPIDVAGKSKTYMVYIRDGGNPTKTLNGTDDTIRGQGWVILAMANSTVNLGEGCTSCNDLQNGNYSFLMTSTGVKCKTKLALTIEKTLDATNLKSIKPCGEKSENW